MSNYIVNASSVFYANMNVDEENYPLCFDYPPVGLPSNKPHQTTQAPTVGRSDVRPAIPPANPTPTANPGIDLSSNRSIRITDLRGHPTGGLSYRRISHLANPLSLTNSLSINHEYVEVTLKIENLRRVFSAVKDPDTQLILPMLDSKCMPLLIDRATLLVGSFAKQNPSDPTTVTLFVMKKINGNLFCWNDLDLYIKLNIFEKMNYLELARLKEDLAHTKATLR